MVTEEDDSEPSSPVPKRKPEGPLAIRQGTVFGRRLAFFSRLPFPHSAKPRDHLPGEREEGQKRKRAEMGGKWKGREAASLARLLHLRQVSATKLRGLNFPPSKAPLGIHSLPLRGSFRHCILTDTRKAPESSVS